MRVTTVTLKRKLRLATKLSYLNIYLAKYDKNKFHQPVDSLFQIFASLLYVTLFQNSVTNLYTNYL